MPLCRRKDTMVIPLCSRDQGAWALTWPSPFFKGGSVPCAQVLVCGVRMRREQHRAAIQGPEE